MTRFLTRFSIQTQLSFALGAIGLVFCASLVGAVVSADTTQRTFAEVADRRLPAIIASFDAKERALALRSRFEALVSAKAVSELEAASAETAAEIAAITEGAQRFVDETSKVALAQALAEIDAAREEAKAATAARIAADAAGAKLWADVQALHAKLNSELANRVDEATFDLTLNAEDAKDRLSETVSGLANDDVETLMLFMRLQAAIAEAEGVVVGLEAAGDVAKRSALLDRLDSAEDGLKALLQSAPEEAGEALGTTRRIVELLALATDPARKFEFISAGGEAEILELKRKASKELADFADEANFEMVLAAEELSDATSDEIDRLSGAMTGEFRKLLDAGSQTHLALGRFAQIFGAPTRDAVVLLENDAATLLAQLREYAAEPALAAFGPDLSAFADALGGDGNAFQARRAQFAALERAAAATGAGSEAIDGLIAKLTGLADLEQERIASGMADALSTVAGSRDLQVVAGVVCLATILAVALLFIRPVIVAPLRAFRESVARLAQGEKVALPGMERGDEIGALARSMEAIYERGVEAARIRIALDNSSALMMVADAEHRIGYVNDTLKKLLGEHLDAIRTRFPDFDPEALVGANIDIFHAQPDKTRGEVEALTDEHRARIRLGDSIFTLAVSPVVSETGERLGSVVEWRDMTVELRIQEQIDQAVGAAVDGDFTQRVDATGAPDQLRIVAEKINTLLSSVDAGVSDTSAAVEALSNGDLTHEMTGSHRGAFATLQQNVNASIAKLSEVVGAIHGAAHRISMRTDNIRDGASQLSSRTESQASTLEETAATMEEITATTKESASSAANASSMVGTALSDAEASGRIVGEAVEAMQRIEASATRISEIISVIDAIAFQTNLLALNAAVEAARAGDAGKGFAVVAAEVRALAQRAGDAAKDIRELIEESGAHVTSGVSHVHQTGDALTKIIDDVKSVTDRIREISSAASEQASGIAEITSAVNSMDEMTQQNAAMAEQSANGAGELSDEAQKLMQLVSHFRARGGEQPAAAADVTNASAPAAMAAASVGARSSAAASEEWREF